MKQREDLLKPIRLGSGMAMDAKRKAKVLRKDQVRR
jgi:hypothetical protein